MSAPILACQRLQLRAFPDAPPLDLTLSAGERWLITGPAGSGKSTLARTLLGLLAPADGGIRLFGEDLDTLSPTQLRQLRRRNAFLQEADGLFSAWTGFDNLALPLHYGANPALTGEQAIADYLVACCQRYRVPESWLEQPVTSRSRDQRLALALLRALLPKPQLIVIDGLPLAHVLTGSGIDGERLLDEALASQPALILLLGDDLEENDRDRALPAALPMTRFRCATLHDGRLQWAPGSPAQPAS